MAEAVCPVDEKGDVATNPKPSCVFQGQFPCVSLLNPLTSSLMFGLPKQELLSQLVLPLPLIIKFGHHLSPLC